MLFPCHRHMTDTRSNPSDDSPPPPEGEGVKLQCDARADRLMCCSEVLAGNIWLLIYHLPQAGRRYHNILLLILYLDPQGQR